MKKNVRLCLILLCLILPVSCSSLAQIGETVYYVAPHDAVSYHVDPDCPIIPSQNGASLLALTPEALSEAPYQTLLPCTLCFGQLEGNALEEMARTNPFVYRPRSAYDTAKNSTLITQAGAYLADSPHVDVLDALIVAVFFGKGRVRALCAALHLELLDEHQVVVHLIAFLR